MTEVVNFFMVTKQQATEAAYSNFYCCNIIALKVFENDYKLKYKLLDKRNIVRNELWACYFQIEAQQSIKS